MKDKLSIIVPIYNVEKYLKKCIESLIHQTYQNLEIILVDDGSTDSSGKIADEYKKIDNRVKVIHKKNGGLSDARNKGLDIATGKYVAFVDSDDWVDNDAYQYSISMMKKNKSDMFVFRAISCYNDKEYEVKNSNEYEIINNENIFDYWEIIGRGVCDKVFIRKYWDDIRFPFGKTSEDIFVIYKLMAKAKTTILSSNIYYYYRQRLGSISKNRNVRMDSHEAYINAREFIKNNYSQSYYIFMKNYVKNCMGLYNSIILYDKDNKFKEDVFAEIKDNKRYILENNCSFIKKIQIYILIHFKKLYFIIMKLQSDRVNKKLYNDSDN